MIIVFLLFSPAVIAGYHDDVKNVGNQERESKNESKDNEAAAEK